MKVIETEVKIWDDLQASISSVNLYLSHNPDNGLLQEIRKALKLDEEVKENNLWWHSESIFSDYSAQLWFYT